MLAIVIAIIISYNSYTVTTNIPQRMLAARCVARPREEREPCDICLHNMFKLICVGLY